MNSEPKSAETNKEIFKGEFSAKRFEKSRFTTPTCPHSSIVVKTAPRSRRNAKVSRKRLSFTPTANSFTMASPDCSPIPCEHPELHVSISPSCGDFSPREFNRILKLEAETSFPNLSFLNKTISMETLLKSRKMEKYVDIFRKEEIDNLAVFSTLTEQDLIEIGINKKKDRIIILEIVAECQEEA